MESKRLKILLHGLLALIATDENFAVSLIAFPL